MRVVHVFSALYQGGAESQLERLITASDDSVEHVVITLKNVETPLVIRLKSYGVKVLTCGMNQPFDLLGLFRLNKIIRQQKNSRTVVQCWMYHANFIGWCATLGMSLPIFWNIRRTLPPSGLTGVISRASALVSKFSKVEIFCNSLAGIESHAASGYRRQAFLYAPNGFYQNAALISSDFFRDIGLDQENINIGCVGRYDPIKGHRFLIEAFGLQKALLPARIWEKLTLVLVGREIEMAQEIRSLINELNISKKVVFLGERQDVDKVLKCFDVFCLPSLSEGFPNVLVEAMLAGLPCIASNVGDVANILDASEYIVEPGSSRVLAEVLSVLVVKDKKFRFDLGCRNKDTVLKKYTMESSLASYQERYLKALDNRDLIYKT